jgi:chemosensory pili system protein ChpA (sensor histidine kinase/response regulator)
VADLQTRITQARMVPVGQLFTRLRLAVSDAARRLGTPVQVAMAGDDLTLDRALIDGVAGPFLHLVRNAVAHGIEAGPARLAAGKSEAGTITLTARQDAGQMVLEVRDDGRGLNLAALAARARALGLLAADEQPNDEALTELVFAPGLSTSSATDSVSGRGLGCDVARREIQRLGGSLRVTTTPGVGTVFTATLPLTLAITRALLIRQGGLGYAVPMVFLERIVDLEVVRVVTAAGGEGLWLGEDGGLLPLRRLGPVLGLPARPTGPALLLRLGDRHWALAVDEVGFQTDIVVGSLGHLLAGHPLFAGATVTGTGELVPILDVAGLLAAGLSAVPAAPVAVPAAAGPTGPTVLVVDDSLSVRRAAEVALTGLGARVVTAVDGEEALVRLRQGGIDLVFTDLEMPKLNGYDLLREIRSVPAWRDLPVVVVTSRAGGKHRDLATSLGATGYITKPFATEALASFLPRREQAP